jgi:pilus assembly protein Flp/PilA
MRQMLARLVREEEGQDLIEYALLAGFISIVAIIAITALGGGVNAVYEKLQKEVEAIGK